MSLSWHDWNPIFCDALMVLEMMHTARLEAMEAMRLNDHLPVTSNAQIDPKSDSYRLVCVPMTTCRKGESKNSCVTLKKQLLLITVKSQ